MQIECLWWFGFCILGCIEFLESILTAYIPFFGKGMKWDVDRTISLRIDEIVLYKQQKLLAFNVRFWSNVFLPDYLGLGRGGSLGFGTVSRVRESKWNFS